MKHLFFISLIILILVVSSKAGTIDPNTPDTKYLEYSKTEQFECIGRLCGKDSEGMIYCASAVAIKPRWILTAAHVVKNSKSCKLLINGKDITIIKIIPHKDFVYDNYGEYDIALCKTNDDIGIKKYPELYKKTDETKKKCSISGYELNGTFSTGCNKSDTNKRAGTNIIDSIDKHLLICTPSSGQEKTNLEYIIANGDSGGGLFIDGMLAGINSCVMTTDKVPDSSYGDEGCHTRVSIFIDWIESNTEE